LELFFESPKPQTLEGGKLVLKEVTRSDRITKKKLNYFFRVSNHKTPKGLLGAKRGP